MPGIDVFELIDNRYIKVDYIKSDDEINKETEASIKEKYSESEELKLLRLNDRNSQEFTNYNGYVEKCRSIGAEKRQAAAEARAVLTEIDLPQADGDEVVKIWVRQ